MADAVRLDAVRGEIRVRGEIDDNYVTDAEILPWINGSYHELYDLLVSLDPDRFESTDDISVVSGTASYALASDLYILNGVDVLDSGTTYRNLRPYNKAERNALNSSSGDKFITRYRMRGSNLVLVPTPAWSGTVRCYYIPVPTALSSDSDTFEAVNGWEEYIICDCLLKFAGREESSTLAQLAAAQKAAVTKRIHNMAGKRDIGEPAKIRDVGAENAADWYPSYFKP